MQRCLFRALTRQLFDARKVLALLLTLDNSGLQGLRSLWVPVQEVVKLSLEKFEHKAFQCGPVGSHILRTQLGFGLGLKDGLLHLDGDGCRNPASDVLGIVILAKKIAHHPDVGFAEGALVGASLGCELTVDEALVILPVGVSVCQRHFDVLSLQMHDGVAQLAVQSVLQKVFEAMFTPELLPIQVQAQSSVQVGVVPKQLLHMLGPKSVGLENLCVWFEPDARTVPFGGGFQGSIIGENSGGETGPFHLAFTHTFHHKLRAQGIHCLGAHAIQPHRLLESPAVVLAPCIDLGNTIHHLAQWDSPSVITDTHLIVFDDHFHFAPMAHGVFIDAIVHHLFEQDINAIVGVLAIAQLADVHARTHADVLLPIQAADVVFCVRDLFCHFNSEITEAQAPMHAGQTSTFPHHTRLSHTDRCLPFGP